MSRWWAAAMVVMLPLVAGCADGPGERPGNGPGSGPGDGEPSAEQVQPLSKADSWRDGLVDALGHDPPFALVEIAFDRAAAERAWAENVPDEQPEASGVPDEEGRYGELADVDLATHALVVWSSGQSGSCPGWLADIATDDAGTVAVETDQRGAECTDDYNAYRMVLSVPKEQLPDPDQLPIGEVQVNGRPLQWDSLVTRYPAAE